ncbi:MAG: DNA mismatch repair endonuclease MutL [Simkaniaceae bacterium]|nr:DNA mismatch repair endonuclease MutL [Simkaniaceae bacterium]
MKTKIRVLSEKIINQIAAGEVVENPSSALKELIENGIDAGARKIWIDVQGGGFTKFTVSDDGEGMSRDDAILAFERHATSKVSAYEDLLSLTTMGFRGEALSSIAAVSKISLLTSNGEEGTALEIVGGKMVACTGGGRQKGTTITVHSLFFNTPARKKFQVTSSASQSLIVKMIQKMVFAHPEVQFSLKCGDREILCFEETSLVSRGKMLLQGMRVREVDISTPSFRLAGVIAEPIEARGNRSGQCVVINNRPVDAFEVAEAVKEGFGTRLGTKEYPCFALHLSVPSEEVDVNVHPQKSKVRFADKDTLSSFIREAIQQTFAPSVTVQPSRAFSEFAKEKWDQAAFSFPIKEAPLLPVKPHLNLEEMEPIGVFAHFLILRGEELLFMHLPRVHQTLMEPSSQKTEQGIQHLLEPLSMELSAAEMETVLEKLELLRSFGLLVRPFGDKTLIVEGVAQDVDCKRVKEIIKSIAMGGNVEQSVARGKKYRFSFEEAKGMLQVLKKRANQETSPEGKPLFIRLSQHAIQALFV